MRKSAIAFALFTTLTTSGCGILLRYVGDAAAVAITQKTADTSQIAARVLYSSNLFPREANTLDVEYGGDAWQPEANNLTLVLMKRSGIGMWELDGAIEAQSKPNGPWTPLTYIGKGAYTLTYPKNDNGPRTIRLTPAGGAPVTLKVNPAKPITIKAVNGKPAASGAPFDLGKDLVLDLANPPGASGMVSVKVLTTVMGGLRNFTEAAIFKANNRVVVPKSAFNNLLVTGSAQGVVNVEKGASYILVERFTQDVSWPRGLGAAEVIGRSWSTAPVNVTGDAPMNIGLEVKGGGNGAFYQINKPNAFYAPPLLPGRNLAVGALRARGTLFAQKVDKSEHYGYQTITTITRTTTWKFPALSDAHWNSLLNDLERGLQSSLKRAANVQLQPIEAVQRSASYQQLSTMRDEAGTRTHQDEVVAGDVEKTLRNSKYLLPETFADSLSSFSSTFAADRPLSRIMREAHVDGLLGGNLELGIASQEGTGAIVLIPTLNFTIYGPPNGYQAGPTAYAYGRVAIGQGLPFNEAQLKGNASELSRIVRVPDLLAAFEASLKALRAKEGQEGYDAIWKLH